MVATDVLEDDQLDTKNPALILAIKNELPVQTALSPTILGKGKPVFIVEFNDKYKNEYQINSRIIIKNLNNFSFGSKVVA
jgi:hypothetical protein